MNPDHSVSFRAFPGQKWHQNGTGTFTLCAYSVAPRGQPPTGRRPASPLRLAPGGVGRLGPEDSLDHAAGSIGGMWSFARGPMAPFIHAAGTTSGAPFPASAPCPTPLQTPFCSRIVFWNHRRRAHPARNLGTRRLHYLRTFSQFWAGQGSMDGSVGVGRIPFRANSVALPFPLDFNH